MADFVRRRSGLMVPPEHGDYRPPSLCALDPLFFGVMASSGGATDPYWASVKFLLTGQGANGSTPSTEATGKALTWGTATVTTSQSKWYGSSLSLASGTTGVSAADSADWQLGGGTGAFTIDFWGMRPDNSAGFAAVLFQGNDSVNNWQVLWNTGSMTFNTLISGSGESVGIPSSTALDGQWHHFAYVRSANAVKSYLDGALQNTLNLSAPYQTIQNYAQPLEIGMRNGSGGSAQAYINDLRITAAARWTSNFTPDNYPAPTI